MKTAQLYTKKIDGSRDNFNPIVDEADVLPTQESETAGKFLMSTGQRSIWRSVLPEQTPATSNKFLKSTGTAGAEQWTDVTLPTKLSELTNDVGYITTDADITGNAATATLATTANGLNSKLTIKDYMGTDVEFNGTSNVDLSNGVYYAATSGTAVSAATAVSSENATKDSSNQQIDTTYVKDLSVAGRVITFVKGDGTTDTITTQDTTYSDATSSTSGLMSNSDKSKLDGINPGGVATGLIGYCAYGSAPDGWLICDGGAISRTTYDRLFNKIGTIHGGGDGSTTFNLPNLIGIFAQGADTSIGSTVAAGLPAITGWYVASDWFRDVSGVSSDGALFNDNSHGSRGATGTSGYSGNQGIGFNAARCSSIYGASTTVQPPSMKLLPCIKY